MSEPQKPASPLSPSECAELIGVTRFFIYDAIHAGELPAETIRRTPTSRPFYRIHEDDFLAWLRRIGWSRIPERRSA